MLSANELYSEGKRKKGTKQQTQLKFVDNLISLMAEMDTKTEQNAPESLFEKIKSNNDTISSHSSRSSLRQSSNGGNQTTKFV